MNSQATSARLRCLHSRSRLLQNPQASALCLGLALLLTPFIHAQAPQASPGSQPAAAPADEAPLDPVLGLNTLRLWTGPAPHARGERPDDIPTLTVMRPTRPNGTAVIIAPGGGYLHLSANLEGLQPGARLTAAGVTVFILKYRLGSEYLYPVPLEDAWRAIRLVRSLAPRFGIDPQRIGMMGYSAGGHLAAMAGVAPQPGDPNAADPVDRQPTDLAFLILGYPWLNAMQPQVIDQNNGNKRMINYCSVIKGRTQADCEKLAQQYTPTLHVGPNTPPAFLYHTTDDRTVPVKASIDFYLAMQAAGRDAELHVFAHGSHGSGLGGNDPALSEWPDLLTLWLRAHGWLTPPHQP